MKTKIKIGLASLLFLGVIAFLWSFLSTQHMPVLDPKGVIAISQRKLLFDATRIMLIVVIPVFVLMLAFAWKYRAGNSKAKYTPDWAHSYVAESLWWGIPCLIIIWLAVLTWTSSHALDPFKPLESSKQPVHIQVVALDWKWLFIYPDQGIATVNFVQFPENTPVNFEITSDAPMNSFWIPALGGQIYAMPGMRTELHLMANENGTFRGGSSNFSGVGFAGMTFTAKATSLTEFNQWVQSVKGSKASLDKMTYHELAKPSKNNPVAFYLLKQPKLFDQIIMKYKMPAQ